MPDLKRRFAYTAIVEDRAYIIGQADKGVPGYTPCPQFGEFTSYEAAVARAQALNAALGLSDADAWRIVASTMRRSTHSGEVAS